MALSEAEEKWLEDRDAIQFATGEYLCGLYPEMLVDDFRDAAEFEARVALELTDYDASYRPSCPDNCRSIRNCRECHLMYARIAVEADMDRKS